MATPKSAFICPSCTRALRKSLKQSTSTRALFSSTSRIADTGVAAFEDRSQIPRWKQTPPAMKMAFRVRPLPNQPLWKVNEDEEVLNQAMDKFIGDAAGRGVRGRDVLTEEVKWLSVTHKSFEQGARGYNDRLAFLGKRILDLQTSKALLQAPLSFKQPPGTLICEENRIGPLQAHPAVKGVENITTFAKRTVLAPKRMTRLAQEYGLHEAVRWKPRQVEQLGASGIEGVMAHAICAIIGAVALQHGGKIANQVAVQRILRPLGLDFGLNI